MIGLSVVGGGWLGSIGGGVAVSLLGLWGVDGGSLVGDISDESVDMVSSVGGGLDSAIGKSNNEATSDNTIAILALSLLEVGLAVVIVDSILICERLGGQLLLLVDHWRGGTIGGGPCCKGNSHQGRGKGNLGEGCVKSINCSTTMISFNIFGLELKIKSLDRMSHPTMAPINSFKI